MLKKYQTDSHVIYGTLRLEIFIKYPLITRESRLFAEIREIKKVFPKRIRYYVFGLNTVETLKMKNTDTWYIQDKEFLNGNCLLKF